MTDRPERGSALPPRETLPVPLFESVILAARGADGAIWLCLNDLCDVLGLELTSQRRRIAADESLHLQPFAVPRGNQVRTLDFLLLDDLAVWLASIQQRRVGAAARERFSYVRQYLQDAVRRAFSELTGLPQAPSNTIEDLRDLDRVDTALRGLQELRQRQDAADDRHLASHEHVRALLDELRDRVQRLEQEVRNRITPQQRHTIDQFVQRIAALRAERNKVQIGVAKRQTWQELNSRFGVTTYADLPAARYDEILRYLRDQLYAYGGGEFDAVEQQGLL